MSLFVTRPQPQGGCDHFPGEAVPVPKPSSDENLFLIPNPNLPWINFMLFSQFLSMVMREKSAVLSSPLPLMRELRLQWSVPSVSSRINGPSGLSCSSNNFPSRPLIILMTLLWMLWTLTGEYWHTWSIMPMTHGKVFAFIEKHHSRPGIWIRVGQSIKKASRATWMRLSCQSQRWYLLWCKD